MLEKTYRYLLDAMETGSLSMKPNFKEMSFSELRAYIVANRNDDEAIHELFFNRRNPNAKRYSADLTEEEINEVLKRKINGEL